jgi:hypothetical protein
VRGQQAEPQFQDTITTPSKITYGSSIAKIYKEFGDKRAKIKKLSPVEASNRYVG